MKLSKDVFKIKEGQRQGDLEVILPTVKTSSGVRTVGYCHGCRNPFSIASGKFLRAKPKSCGCGSNIKVLTIGGNTFPSCAAAARHYGLPESRVLSRVKAGWTARQAVGLDKPPKNKVKHFISPLGERMSLAEAHTMFGIEIPTMQARLKAGWSDRQIVELDPKPPRSAGVTIHGVWFSYAAAAKKFKLSPDCISGRKKRGLSDMQAVGLAKIPVNVRSGVKKLDFGRAGKKTVSEASKKWGVAQATLRQRIKTGWTPREAVGLDERPRHKKISIIFKIGNRSFSATEAAAEFGLLGETIRHRRKLGWTDRQAVGLDPPPKRRVRKKRRGA